MAEGSAAGAGGSSTSAAPGERPQRHDLRLPARLVAPGPGWSTAADVIVVGSGIAGLTTALRLRQRVDRVLLVTKTVLNAGSTLWAQGGIAAALAPEDTPEEHLHDTLVAGVGICDVPAVTALVHEGPARVRELVGLGAEFDLDEEGGLKLTREGGHRRDRIAHAGGDATGREISRALIAALQAVIDDPGIEVIEHALVVDLLQDTHQRVCGVTLHVIGEGQIDGVGAAHARAVVLATGGLGQVYSATTNPAVATGEDHVYLDARHLGKEVLEDRFPSIVARCRELGFDPVTELLPVAPAQHYASGGVRTDLLGRSSLDGLYACGEVACSGVHGANRLASNSLLEGLVFAHRIADDITGRLASGELPATEPAPPAGPAALLHASQRVAVQHAMTQGAGAVRSAASLAATARDLEELARGARGSEPGPQSWETTNLLHIGQLLTLQAALREETRGGHLRSDFPDRDDEHWRGHSHAERHADGSVTTTFLPVPRQDPA